MVRIALLDRRSYILGDSLLLFFFQKKNIYARSALPPELSLCAVPGDKCRVELSDTKMVCLLERH